MCGRTGVADRRAVLVRGAGRTVCSQSSQAQKTGFPQEVSFLGSLQMVATSMF